MKNLLFLFIFLSLISFSCGDEDTRLIEYPVDISINNPIENNTYAVSEMIPLEVGFSRDPEEVIYHVKIELLDSAGNSILTLLEEHVDETENYTYSLDMAFSVNEAGTYTLKASSHDLEDQHANPQEITINIQ